MSNLDDARQCYIERNTGWANTNLDSVRRIKIEVGLSAYSINEDYIDCCKDKLFSLSNIYIHLASPEHIGLRYGVDPEEVAKAQAAVDMIRRLRGY